MLANMDYDKYIHTPACVDIAPLCSHLHVTPSLHESIMTTYLSKNNKTSTVKKFSIISFTVPVFFSYSSIIRAWLIDRLSCVDIILLCV